MSMTVHWKAWQYIYLLHLFYQIILHALKHEKAQARASQPTPFMIPSGIAKELTSMMQTWLMNEAACPPAVRQEPDNTLNLLDVDFWLWY